MRAALPLLLLASGLPAQKQPSGVRVLDAATAVKIAEPALIRVYGKRHLGSEKPLTAKLDNGVWNVYGTLYCHDPKGGLTSEVGQCAGGVATLRLRQSDGKILSIFHTK